MKKPMYLLVFAIILSIAALFCSINIVIGVIYGASSSATEILIFYNDMANKILCVADLINATVGLLLSILLIVKKKYRVPSLVTLSVCIASYIPVLLAILI